MRRSGIVIIRGIVQGVGFRPFVYAQAFAHGIKGYVKNLGSEVEILAFGDRFEEFLASVSRGTLLSRIDSIEVGDAEGEMPEAFTIRESGTGSLTGFIPPDVAICEECIGDIDTVGGRYEKYWATSCVNCGPRYSIIRELPYDRVRTSMHDFPMCEGCLHEYTDPVSRRHHAQTITCETCGPSLQLLGQDGGEIRTSHPVREAAALLDNGNILGVRGIGGFHIACIEESARELKVRLGRTEQPFAVMVRPSYLGEIAVISDDEWKVLTSPIRPIVVLKKRDPGAHSAISNLHTIGCMLPYTGLHHLLFSYLVHPLLIMTSANMPGYPMITEIETAKEKLKENVDYFLTHNRSIVNRCDDSVIRDGYLIRLSRGFAPTRTHINLGCKCILGVGPELNANATLYKGGVCITSPHVGHVRNPPTLAYLQETIRKITDFLGARYDIIAHDLHPAFLSTRYAKELADEYHAELVPVQHHEAHIAATTKEACVGIAIDGVGYGRDGTVWGGEIFTGTAPHFQRVAHLQYVPMPGGDLATRYPERMLYGILPTEETLNLLSSRGWDETALRVLKQQVARGFNTISTSSTGRMLDAVAALLGICRERTYDGEPAMRLESEACLGLADDWPIPINQAGGVETLSSRALVREAFEQYGKIPHLSESEQPAARARIAASFQHNLARGIAKLAINAAQREGYHRVALSGGVAYNEAIRTTIEREITGTGLEFIMNRDYPLGDGCISYGQCVVAGLQVKDRESP
ncbi:MAG: carbamoyltransferase HypF [Methanomicrobiales archaeon]|nr:carbamoyltransferase HypF [Methanomicrobiales archaeon]